MFIYKCVRVCLVCEREWRVESGGGLWVVLERERRKRDRKK